MAEVIGYQFDRVMALPIETDRQVQTILNRDLIISKKRWIGMKCFVVSENTDYQLLGGITNADWVAISGNNSITESTATHYLGEFNAGTLSPALTNAVGSLGDEYKVTGALATGTAVDFGSGNITLYNDDIILHDGAMFFVKSRYLEADKKVILLDVSGDVFQAPVIGTNSVKTYNIPANTFKSNALLSLKGRVSRIDGTGNPFISIRSSGSTIIDFLHGVNAYNFERDIAINDTEIRSFTVSGNFYDDSSIASTSTLYTSTSINRTLATTLTLQLNFSLALTDEYKLEYLIIEQKSI